MGRLYTFPEQTISTTGIATEAKQDATIAAIGTTNTKLDTLIAKDYATSAKQDTIIAAIGTTNTKLDSTNTKIDSTNTKLDTIIAKDFATSAKQDTTNTKLDTIITNTALAAANTALTVVDQIDTTPLLDVSLSNIPASSANSLQIVASLATAAKRVQTVEDIGEFFGLYSGAVATPTLLCVLPLGGGEVDVAIPAGTLVSIRHMKNTAITSGYIAINFLG